MRKSNARTSGLDSRFPTQESPAGFSLPVCRGTGHGLLLGMIVDQDKPDVKQFFCNFSDLAAEGPTVGEGKPIGGAPDRSAPKYGLDRNRRPDIVRHPSQFVSTGGMSAGVRGRPARRGGCGRGNEPLAVGRSAFVIGGVGSMHNKSIGRALLLTALAALTTAGAGRASRRTSAKTTPPRRGVPLSAGQHPPRGGRPVPRQRVRLVPPDQPAQGPARGGARPGHRGQHHQHSQLRRPAGADFHRQRPGRPRRPSGDRTQRLPAGRRLHPRLQVRRRLRLGIQIPLHHRGQPARFGHRSAGRLQRGTEFPEQLSVLPGLRLPQRLQRAGAEDRARTPAEASARRPPASGTAPAS